MSFYHIRQPFLLYPVFTALLLMLAACGSPDGVQGYTVSAEVSGLQGKGLRLSLNGAESLTVAQDGTVKFKSVIPYTKDFQVTIAQQPSEPVQTCVVKKQPSQIKDAIKTITVMCETTTFKVGGTVNGLFGRKLELEMAEQRLLLRGNGEFQFEQSLQDMSTYTVKVVSIAESVAQECTVSPDEGLINGADVLNIEVTCVVDAMVSPSQTHTCYNNSDGQVKCWGDNTYRRLGQGVYSFAQGDDPGEMGNGLPVLDMGTGRHALQVAPGESHTCAVLDNGRVRCWGQNLFGALGLGPVGSRGDEPGEMGDALPYVDLGSDDLGDPLLATQVTSGRYFSCALIVGGQVKCWGVNWSGQLGLGDTQIRGDDADEMGDALPFVDLGSDSGGAHLVVQAIDAGQNFVCALFNSGLIKCWGSGVYGALGYGNNSAVGLAPTDMGNNLPFVDLGGNGSVTASAISIGYNHSCALLTSKRIKCWGINSMGQLGQGNGRSIGSGTNTMGDNLPPIDLGDDGAQTPQPLLAQAITTGVYHTCALVTDGRVRCWGGNFSGVLGYVSVGNIGDETGEMGNKLLDVQFGYDTASPPNPLYALEVSAGALNSCARVSNGSLKCWGDNNLGLNGQETTSTRLLPPGAVNLGSVQGVNKTAKAITLSFLHACVLLDDDSLKCWGDNRYSQLGLGLALQPGDEPDELGLALSPVDLGSGVRVRKVSSGLNHTCALLESRTVKCWGDNSAFQAGYPPLIRSGRHDWLTLSGDALPIVDVGVDDNGNPLTVSDIVTGSRHTCVLLDDGVVKCWGDNTFGQVASGDFGGSSPDNNNKLSVFTVDLGTDSTGASLKAVSIATHSDHNCALLENERIKCWGYNRDGALGLGVYNAGLGRNIDEMGNNLPYVDLGSDEKGDYLRVKAISLGDSTSCALLQNDRVKCWGYGFFGFNRQTRIGDQAEEMGDALPYIDLGSDANGAALKVSKVAAGDFSICTLLTTGEIKCWGRSDFGTLGLEHIQDVGYLPDEMGNALSPVDLGTTPAVKQFTLAHFTACALFVDDRIKCWGYNDYGQLGVGDSAKHGGVPGTMGDNLPFIQP